MSKLNMTRRGMIGGSVAAATVVASGGFKAARAQLSPKTFVLVPGAFLGGWCWQRVSDVLEGHGHKVFSLTLSGLGERSHLLNKSIDLDTHIADIVNVIKRQSLTDVSLVAHSYAGFPCSGALEQIGDRVSSIFWLDAFKPENGQKMSDFTNEAFLKVLKGAADKGEAGFGPPPKTPPVMVAEKDVAFVRSKATPHPIGTYMQAIELTGAREKVANKTYIRIPRFPHPALNKAMAEAEADQSWNTFKLTNSGHMGMLDAPENVAWLLEDRGSGLRQHLNRMTK